MLIWKPTGFVYEVCETISVPMSVPILLPWQHGLIVYLFSFFKREFSSHLLWYGSFTETAGKKYYKREQWLHAKCYWKYKVKLGENIFSSSSSSFTTSWWHVLMVAGKSTCSRNILSFMKLMDPFKMGMVALLPCLCQSKLSKTRQNCPNYFQKN